MFKIKTWWEMVVLKVKIDFVEMDLHVKSVQKNVEHVTTKVHVYHLIHVILWE